MCDINYKALAAIMREYNAFPSSSMSVLDYHSAQAIYALIHALEEMATPSPEYPLTAAPGLNPVARCGDSIPSPRSGALSTDKETP